MSDVAFWLVFITIILFDLFTLGVLFASERIARLISVPCCISIGVTTGVIFNGCVAGTLVSFPWIPTIVLASSQIPFGFFVKTWFDDFEGKKNHLAVKKKFWLPRAVCYAMILVSILLKTASV